MAVRGGRPWAEAEAWGWPGTGMFILPSGPVGLGAIKNAD